VGTPLIIFMLAFLYLSLAVIICAPGPDQKKPPQAVAHTLHALILAAFAGILGYAYQGEAVPVFLIIVFVLLLLAMPILYLSPNPHAESLEDITSKEGLLVLVAWLLLALSVIILVATMWPVIIDTLKAYAGFLPGFIAGRLPKNPSGLDISFYNNTCLPLFTFLAVLLLVCPFRKWKLSPGTIGFSQPKLPAAAVLTALILALGLWMSGITNPVALIAAASSVAAILGIVTLFGSNTQLLSVRSLLAAHGTHIGVLLITLGVAFSGPYQEQYTLQLAREQMATIGSYQIKLNQLYEGESQIGADGKPNVRFVEAELIVANKNGAPLGVLSPQRRLYTKATC
jgi:cytochrome c-type biogenesis protein CcmF